MGIEFGKNARHVHDKGEVMVSFQYVNGEEAMVLYPAHRRSGPGAFVVCLSSLWKYRDDDYLVQQAKVAARVMGFGEDGFIVHKIADVINWGIIELISMKPQPDELVPGIELDDLRIDDNRIVMVGSVH